MVGPRWPRVLRSCLGHPVRTRLIDVDAWRTVKRYLHPTSIFLSSQATQPAELRRKGATLSLARRAMEPRVRLNALWADHWLVAEWLDNTISLRTFIPNIGAHHPWMALPQEQRGSGLTASTLASVVSPPGYNNGVWTLLRLLSVAQRKRALTMFSSNVQSIDLLMEWYCAIAKTICTEAA